MWSWVRFCFVDGYCFDWWWLMMGESEMSRWEMSMRSRDNQKTFKQNVYFITYSLLHALYPDGDITICVYIIIRVKLQKKSIDVLIKQFNILLWIFFCRNLSAYLSILCNLLSLSGTHVYSCTRHWLIWLNCYFPHTRIFDLMPPTAQIYYNPIIW